MNKIDKLIKEMCPNGVEYKKLGEIGFFNNTGVDKKTNDGEKEIILLNYMDVYKNRYIGREIPKMVVTASENKIKTCNVLKGDILITPTSETKDDIGHAAVITDDLKNTCYSYHIMRYRLFENNMITSFYLRYLFRSDIVQNQIDKLAQGMTRFGVSKSKFEAIKIPVPPIEVQNEIVKILDKFVELEAELEAELETRKKQYRFYETSLIFSDKYNFKKLSDVCVVNQGLQIPINKRKKEPGENRYFYITVQFLKGNSENYYIENPQSNVICDVDDILVTRTGSTGKIITGVNGCFHNNFFKVECYEMINKRYMYYLLKSKKMYKRLLYEASGGTVPDLPHKKFYNIEIPVPSIEEQEFMVNVLDKFDKLVDDISEGLPTEIEMRRKQYEYYRNKLLTFEEMKGV